MSGIEMSATDSYYSDILYNKIYNNTFLDNAWNTNFIGYEGAISFIIWNGSHIVKYNAIKNNLYYYNRTPYATYRSSLSDQTFAGNWEGDTQGDPKFVNATRTPGDPMVSTYPDLNLQKTSPAINAGTYLTRISSASGSGTSFVVEDARYFMDGWGIPNVQGDNIQILGTAQTARITNINYNTNTITVDTSLTWTQWQGITLAYEGIAPDIGAYEYVSATGDTTPPAAPTGVTIN